MHRCRSALLVILIAGGCTSGSAVTVTDPVEPTISFADTVPDTVPDTSPGIVTTATTATVVVPPASSADAELRAAYALAHRVADACLLSPATCDRQALGAVLSPDVTAAAFARIDEWIRSGLHARGNRNPAFDYYVIENVAVSAAGDAGTVTVCDVDGSVVFTIENFGGPVEMVLRSPIEGARRAFTYRKVNATWMPEKTDLLEEFDPFVNNLCAAPTP